MTFFRTREQRQADRRWCEQFSDSDEVEDFGHGLVVATSVGVIAWLIVAWMIGWLA